jgi:TRAP-type C4-dicarboxylate transport system permease small subunit
VVRFLDSVRGVVNQWLVWIAGVVLVAMIVLTCGNIFLRIVWTPIKGTFELMEFFGAIVAAFALGYTQMKRGHTGIDIVVSLFSARMQRVLNGINYFVCMAFFAIAGWQITKWATTLWRTGEVTETLRIIFYPFTYAVALGCFVLSFVLLVDFLKVLIQEEGAQ